MARCDLPLVYLKLHAVHEITVLYMALFEEPLSHKKNYLIIFFFFKNSILQCIWNGESISIWSQKINNLKKTLNWTHDTKLDNNWNLI